MNMACRLIQVFMFGAVVVDLSSSAKVPRPRWHAPCSGNSASTLILETGGYQPDSTTDQHRRIARIATRALWLIKTLDQTYEAQFGSNLRRLHSLQSGNENKSVNLVPEAGRVTDKTKVLAVLKQEYQDLSFLAILLEETTRGQRFHEDLLLLPGTAYLLEEVYSLLCTVRGLVASLDGTIDSHLSASSLPHQWRDMPNNAVRYVRDYLFLSYIKNVLTRIESNHAKYTDQS